MKTNKRTNLMVGIVAIAVLCLVSFAGHKVILYYSAQKNSNNIVIIYANLEKIIISGIFI